LNGFCYVPKPQFQIRQIVQNPVTDNGIGDFWFADRNPSIIFGRKVFVPNFGAIAVNVLAGWHFILQILQLEMFPTTPRWREE
jgi:hypothetical protein